jgi:hypothetical protein
MKKIIITVVLLLFFKQKAIMYKIMVLILIPLIMFSCKKKESIDDVIDDQLYEQNNMVGYNPRINYEQNNKEDYDFSDYLIRNPPQINSVYPPYALNSDGSYNPYGHPLSYGILNTLDKLLKENILYKENMNAQDYNTAGMFFYEKKLWNEAELMFSRAIYIDSNYAIAYYNLACIYSIQLTDYYSQLESEPFSRHNEILLEDNTPAMIFAHLDASIYGDPDRGIKARQDSDFDNLRTFDPILFDAITLPEEQWAVHRYDGRFIYLIRFEGDIDLYFVEPDYQGEWDIENAIDSYDSKLWTSFDGHQELLRNLNFYSVEDEYYGTINKEKIGKRFIIEYVYMARGSDYVGGRSLYKYQKIISVKEIP